MKEKLSGKGYRSCHVDDADATRKMKEKLPGRDTEAARKIKENLSGRGYRSLHVDDTEAARKMKEKLPGRRYRSCQEV
jgi:hypothetical protein